MIIDPPALLTGVFAQMAIESLTRQLAQVTVERDAAQATIAAALTDDLVSLAADEVDREDAWRVGRDTLSALCTLPLTALTADRFQVWAGAYQQGVWDERSSEENIGVFGYGEKIEPARTNPHSPRRTPPHT